MGTQPQPTGRTSRTWFVNGYREALEDVQGKYDEAGSAGAIEWIQNNLPGASSWSPAGEPEQSAALAPARPVTGRPVATVAFTDVGVVDAIATLLGTHATWSGADMLEDIANLIGRVRPHPGDTTAPAYRAAFLAATGRTVPKSWDSGDGGDDVTPVPLDPGTGPVPGYVAGTCGHRVAESEWRAGFRTCERCPG